VTYTVLTASFMEYNTPTIFTGEDINQRPRKPDTDNMYYPCNTIIPEKYRSSCYYEISPWWNTIFTKDYEKIGSLCNKITNTKYQESCYMGFGALAPPSTDYDVNRTINLCKKMPDAGAELLCRAGASWVFFSIPEKGSLSPLLCNGLSEENVRYCVQRSDLIGTGEINNRI